MNKDLRRAVRRAMASGLSAEAIAAEVAQEAAGASYGPPVWVHLGLGVGGPKRCVLRVAATAPGDDEPTMLGEEAWEERKAIRPDRYDEVLTAARNRAVAMLEKIGG